jgi:hypothetical protein
MKRPGKTHTLQAAAMGPDVDLRILLLDLLTLPDLGNCRVVLAKGMHHGLHDGIAIAVRAFDSRSARPLLLSYLASSVKQTSEVMLAAALQPMPSARPSRGSAWRAQILLYARWRASARASKIEHQNESLIRGHPCAPF